MTIFFFPHFNYLTPLSFCLCAEVRCNSYLCFTLDKAFFHLISFRTFIFFLSLISCKIDMGFPGGTIGKEPSCQCRRCERYRFHPLVGKIPWSRKWQSTPVFNILRELFWHSQLPGSVVWCLTLNCEISQSLLIASNIFYFLFSFFSFW